jgi:hypothetical protein
MLLGLLAFFMNREELMAVAAEAKGNTRDT